MFNFVHVSLAPFSYVCFLIHVNAHFVDCGHSLSSVLVWDIRLAKFGSHEDERKHKAEEKVHYNPNGASNPFKHLDLCWKPLMKVLIALDCLCRCMWEVLNVSICHTNVLCT